MAWTNRSPPSHSIVAQSVNGSALNVAGSGSVLPQIPGSSGRGLGIGSGGGSGSAVVPDGEGASDGEGADGEGSAGGELVSGASGNPAPGADSEPVAVACCGADGSAPGCESVSAASDPVPAGSP